MKLLLSFLAAVTLLASNVFGAVKTEDANENLNLRRGLKKQQAPTLPNPCTDTSLPFKDSFLLFRETNGGTTDGSNFPNPPCGKDPRDGTAGEHECNYSPRDGNYECEASPTKATDFLDFATGNNGNGTPFFADENQLCVIQGYKLQNLRQWFWVCVPCEDGDPEALCN